MTDPTPPTAAERRAELTRIAKTRRRRGFLLGLLLGQVLVIVLDFSGEFLIQRFAPHVRIPPPLSLRSAVFFGMFVGVGAVALMIAFVLGLQGAGYALRPKKIGFFTALGHGLGHIFRAAWSLGLTLGVIAGTAWLLIPQSQWKPTVQWVQDRGVEGYRLLKEKIGAPPP